MSHFAPRAPIEPVPIAALVATKILDCPD